MVNFVELQTQLQGIHLIDEVEDEITRTISANGKHSSALAYKA
jgi:hypothetical protein